MNLLDVFLIGIALSIDACAITFANCATYKNCMSKRREWLMPIFFALFQGVMPMLGFLLGFALKSFISSVEKYISAGIFLALALKIVFDYVKDCKKEEVCSIKKDGKKQCTTLSITVILLQAFATSIDAFAVGFTFIDLVIPVFVAPLTIALITFGLVSASLFFGKKLGNLFGKYAEWVGASLLFALAVKSLIEGILA